MTAVRRLPASIVKFNATVYLQQCLLFRSVTTVCTNSELRKFSATKLQKIFQKCTFCVELHTRKALKQTWSSYVRLVQLKFRCTVDTIVYRLSSTHIYIRPIYSRNPYVDKSCCVSRGVRSVSKSGSKNIRPSPPLPSSHPILSPPLPSSLCFSPRMASVSETKNFWGLYRYTLAGEF